MTIYYKVDGGYRYANYSIWSVQTYAGYYERVFTVPDDAGLVMLQITSRLKSEPPLTVTDIEIYRID